MFFFQKMQKPQSGFQTDLLNPSTKKASIENPEKKETKEGEGSNTGNEEACSLSSTGRIASPCAVIHPPGDN